MKFHARLTGATYTVMDWPIEKLAFDGAVVGNLAFAVVGGCVFAFVADFLAEFRAAGAEAFAAEGREVKVSHCGEPVCDGKR
jgi:hypothetical protein